jgi:uncharacterized protein YceH (UPF0502 family)
LDPVEARVIGSLVEKQLTTPQQYPLTLNALVLACNQTSNRDPVVDYDDTLVETALSSLKGSGFLRFVHPSHGRSVTRYRQVMEEQFGLESRGLSVLAVMLLRGPQTVGELRTRTERMADFDDLRDIEAELNRLGDRPDPLVRRLQRHPGQKEERWAQLLTGEPSPSSAWDAAGDGATTSRSASLRDEVASLRAEVADLRERLAAMEVTLHDLTR